LAWLLFLAFLGMWPFSYRFYTSFGIDMDQGEPGSIRRTHHRLRWPGDGSFWLGAESFWFPATTPFDAFDLGGAFFRAPRRPQPRSLWNRLGFWFIREERQVTPLPPQAATYAGAFWVGVPSVLPPLLLGFWPIRGWLRKRRASQP
jgi:hypothetical protein